VSKTPAIFRSPTIPAVADALVARTERRMEHLQPPQLIELLSDTVYKERLRFEDEAPSEQELAEIDAAARAIAQGSRNALVATTRRLVRGYAEEIHNPFSSRAFDVATKFLPRALTGLISATDPKRLLMQDITPGDRVVVGGPVEHIKRLAEHGTIILAPTHLSNLDSPLIGYVLQQVGLPPFAYGAGLNLFSNPMMAFWMSRLGAYTVDRRKQGRLYKQTLKDYSVEILRRGCHSLFFPGGTRSRSGLIEKSLKKGLLGTGIQAWQENLHEGQNDGEIFVVPLTLSTSLVLEAETLIRDSLAREGKQRYIIGDDEFSQPRTVASFLKRIMKLDEGVHVVFGGPLDLMGNPVDDRGRSLGPTGKPIDRRRYVCDAHGRVQRDPQRDRIYTQRLSEALVQAYHRDNVALSTHVAAFAAWRVFQRDHGDLDTWRLVRIEATARRLERQKILAEITSVLSELRPLQQQGRIRLALPDEPEQILRTALARFMSFHTRPALRKVGALVVIDPELLLFYRNRLVGYGLDGENL
jgi:glycerol-3-phosphate O-acyltransferase